MGHTYIYVGYTLVYEYRKWLADALDLELQASKLHSSKELAISIKRCQAELDIKTVQQQPF